WSRQYRAVSDAPVEGMDALIAQLQRSIPEDDGASIVHGDFRLDNMVLHPSEPRILAVLDWELSTLGSPLADFTYFLMQWALPRGERSSLIDVDFEASGIPRLDE